MQGDKMRWVRAIISLIGVVGITGGFFMKLISTDAYVGLMAISITWWYKSRDEEKRNNK